MRDTSCTKIDLSIQAEVVDFAQMDENVLEKQMRKQLEENLAMLKKLLEAMQRLPASEINSLPNQG
jgi:hypothetical protein